MKKIKLLLLLFLLITNVMACKEDDAKKYASDLVLQANVSADGSGLVNFISTAKGASYFNYYFGTAPNESPTLSNDGKASYTYGQSGEYNVQVRAYSSSDEYISKSQRIKVTVGAEDDDTDGTPTSGYTTPESYEGMNLVWRDEFDGTQLNEDDWSYEIGTGDNGWGNNELQYYKKENTSVKDGMLTITAKKEDFGGRNYTSSRLVTKDKQTFQFGRVDIRAALPKGQGIWPALWMLGADFSTVGWPACGEIDIMEMIGGAQTGRDNTVHGTVHWQNAGGEYASYTGKRTLESGILADKFHVFSLVWTDKSLTWFIDDIKFHEIDITPADMTELRQKYFLIFNVAVGGNWPGSPDAATVFPQKMVVDYVRFFQKQ